MAEQPLMELRVHDGAPGALVLCGVPFAREALLPGCQLAVTDAAGARLLSWWVPRAAWPDGSVKWAFLHVRLAAATERIRLWREEGPARSAPPGVALEPLDGADAAAARVRVDGVLLEVTAAGWRLDTATCRCAAGFPCVTVDPDQEHAGAYALELVEASPIAPLIRLRQAATTGIRCEHLLRVDPGAGSLEWQQRLSFLGPQACALRGWSTRVEFGWAAGTQERGYRWRFGGELEVRRRLVLPRPGVLRVDEGEEGPGRPPVALSCELGSVELVKAWQRAPCAVQVSGPAVLVELYPDCVPGLVVQAGTSVRHVLRIGVGQPARCPVRWSLDPEQACASGVFGPVVASTARTRRLFAGYEQAIGACFQRARLSRLDKARGAPEGEPAALEDESAQDEEYFGLQHYGDWPMKLGAYGGSQRMYADNEYDTPYAFALHFIRTGEPAYREVAYWSAVHMADLDCKATDGDMRFHGYRETAEDHAEHRTPGGDLGHYWTDGLVLNYLLAGDPWCWEAALAQGRWLLGAFAGTGDEAIRRHFLGCERAVGWPLTALAGIAEVTGDAAILAKMRQMVGFLARFSADPDRELEEVTSVDGRPVQWWRVGQQDGSKPFMLGVVLEGLERYQRLTGDPVATAAIRAICRFLVDVMWVPGVEAFIYEWNAFNRAHREDVYPHYINMMVAPGLAYAHELTGEMVFREVATRAFQAAVWTLFAPGGGKEIGMVGRTSASMLGRLATWLARDQEARAARQRPSIGVPFTFAGSPQELSGCPALRPCAGQPRYAPADGALLSSGDSFQVFSFVEPANTDRGSIEFEFTPAWDCPAHPGPVAQRCYVHLCDRPFTRSCVSIISFYTALHVRFYDSERHYIEVLESDIQHWRAGQPHAVRCAWDVDRGEAVLWLDSQECDRRVLQRRLGGAFKRLHLGHRPGNWRSDGTLGKLRLRLGV